ncbi:hypothetical protein R1flu_000305 [Riccia fluitans]|uniref:Uncharacterized protein n=1 Tax=Riccia fluitans TaxID=41844 RepID=A0ABD1Y027_9MARC
MAAPPWFAEGMRSYLQLFGGREIVGYSAIDEKQCPFLARPRILFVIKVEDGAQPTQLWIGEKDAESP